MIQSLKSLDIIEHSPNFDNVMRVEISLSGKILPKDDYHIGEEDFHFTDGFYYIKFRPVKRPRLEKRPFMMSCDLFYKKIYRVNSWNEIIDRAGKGEPLFMFFVKYTNLSKELFDIARRSVDLAIPFGFDVVKYCKETGNDRFRPESIEPWKKFSYNKRMNSKGCYNLGGNAK